MHVEFKTESYVEDGETFYAVREYHDGEATHSLIEVRHSEVEAELLCLWHNTYTYGRAVHADVAFAKRALAVGYKGNIHVKFVKDGKLDYEAIGRAVEKEV